MATNKKGSEREFASLDPNKWAKAAFECLQADDELSEAWLAEQLSEYGEYIVRASREEVRRLQDRIATVLFDCKQLAQEREDALQRAEIAERERDAMREALEQLRALAREATLHRDFYSGHTFRDVPAQDVEVIADKALARSAKP
jgi:hypothetical protein